MNTCYEHCYYLMKETKNPTYLDFYELDKKDLPHIDCYLEQTVRYNNKWFFVKQAKTYFTTYQQQKNAPQYWIKFLYEKQRHPILKDGTIAI